MKFFRLIAGLILGLGVAHAQNTTTPPLNLLNSVGATASGYTVCSAASSETAPSWCTVASRLIAGSGISITATGTAATIAATGSGANPGGSTYDMQYNAGSSTFGGITMTNGQLVVGQTSATPLAKTLSNDCTLAASGAITCSGLSGAYFAISGPASPTKTFTFPNASATILSTNATVTVPQGGTGTSSFTSNLPLIGAGASPVSQGTVSGNTTVFATVSGAATPSDCVSFDASGNLIDAGGPCTTGGGGGTVGSGAANAVGYYATAGTTISGLATAASGALITSSAGTPSIGPLPLANMATIAANTVLANNTASSSVPIAIALPSCSTSTSALIYTTSTNLGCNTFGTVVTYSTGATGATVPLNNGGFTQSGTANFTGTFQVGTKTMSFPATADTLAGLGTIQTWTAAQTFNTLKLAGATSGAMTLSAPATASTYVMSFPATTDTVAVLGLADQVVTGGVNITSKSLPAGNITIDCGARPQQYITGSTSAWAITAPSIDSNCMLFLTNPGSSVNKPTLTGFSTNTAAAASAVLTTTPAATFTLFIWRINGVSGINAVAM